MELIRMLSPLFKQIAVVSRGYKRQSHGMQLVSDGHGYLAPAAVGGDEPVLIARRFPGCVVLVSASRRKAIQQAIEQHHSDLILLDDAFQHRWVKRDVDLVLLPQGEISAESRLLPAGDLREPLAHLKRANMVMIVEPQLDESKDSYPELARFYRGYTAGCCMEMECLVDSSLKPCGDLGQLAGHTVIVFAGIAKPDSMRDMLMQAGLRLGRFLAFPDHHRYSAADISAILSVAGQEKGTCLLTTEKDLVKLPLDRFSGLKLFAVRLQVRLKSAERFRQKLVEFIDNTG